MMSRHSNCQHVGAVVNVAWSAVVVAAQRCTKCDSCNSDALDAKNLWLCLHDACFYVGCGDSVADHSNEHALAKSHNLIVNLNTLRLWCNTCDFEVYREHNNPSIRFVDCPTSVPDTEGATAVPSPMDSDEEPTPTGRPGLIGLYNIGNTCYMNAALQALSNCVPLVQFFTKCPGYIDCHAQAPLCHAYKELLTQLWSDTHQTSLAPSAVVRCFRREHPTFHAFMQQDTQEFLQCFLNQLHDELKQPVVAGPDSAHNPPHTHRPHEVVSTQSDTDYETCDSGTNDDQLSADEDRSSSSGGDDREPACSSPLVAGGRKVRRSCGAVKTKRRRKSSLPSKVIIVNESTSSDSGLGSLSSVSTVICELDAASKNSNYFGGSGQSLSRAASTVEPGRKLSNSSVESVTCERECCESVATSCSIASPNENQYTSVDIDPCCNTTEQPETDRTPAKKVTPDCTSIISDVFDGQIVSTVQCLACGHLEQVCPVHASHALK